MVVQLLVVIIGLDVVGVSGRGGGPGYLRGRGAGVLVRRSYDRGCASLFSRVRVSCCS